MARSIDIETIGTNAYAPTGADDVNLYAYNGVSDLTLGQLVMAVCIRQAALIERQTVMKMNDVNASASWLSALSLVADRLMTRSSLDAEIDLADTGYVPTSTSSTRITLRNFLIQEAQVKGSALPSDIRTHENKMAAFRIVNEKMSAASINNQEQSIDLQSLLARRDAAYNASAASVKKLGTTTMGMADNF